jgi:hypothetical protein
MLIGVMSDSHDDMGQIRKAVDLFNQRGVALVLHAGDLVSPFTFEVLDDLVAEFAGIFGNNDGDRLLLAEKSKGRVHNQPYFRRFDGKMLAMMHEPDFLNSVARCGDFDIVIYGHLHKPDVRTVAKTLIVNPGKVAELHKGTSTVAIVDTEAMEAEIAELI